MLGQVIRGRVGTHGRGKPTVFLAEAEKLVRRRPVEIIMVSCGREGEKSDQKK